ncbi:MAG TPA: ubiquitin-conjugating enzyme E2 [Terriglobales bacterium]|nr:ubiquitin-conjugating enzyme E2 [Terriglobales bacterium]
MNLSPRVRRLKLDHENLVRRFSGWAPIQVTGSAGLPPEVYRITYKVKGLYVSPAGEILERDTHVMEVNLSLGYPRRSPQCRMLTPVFHPNFDDSTVCIGDFWAASEGLDDLIVRVGRMIAYQEYNTKSPLNGLAAKWAAQNAHLLPIDPIAVSPPALRDVEESEVVVASATATGDSAAVVAPAPAAENAVRESTPGEDAWANKIKILS